MALTSMLFAPSARLQTAAQNAPPMGRGEGGPAVSLLQVALAWRGYPMPISFARGLPDGLYGSETADAVRAFQQAEGLAADGVAGRDTLTRLDRRLADLALPRLPARSPFGTMRGQTRYRPSPKPGARPGPKAPPLGTPVSAPGGSVRGAASYPKPTIVSPPEPVWVQIGKSSHYAVGTNGPDQDLSHDDRADGAGQPPFGMQTTYAMLTHLSDSSLESMWRTSFKTVHGCGQTGEQMIDKFMGGGGGSMKHPDGSDLSKTALNTKTFAEVRLATEQEVRRQLKAQFATGTLDWRKLSVTVDIPFSTGTADLTVPLRFRAMIGGVHGTKLYARNVTFRADPDVDATPAASFDLMFEMGDHFGVGNDDMYTPDLICMNILQHERKDHVPFINWIEIESLEVPAVLN